MNLFVCILANRKHFLEEIIFWLECFLENWDEGSHLFCILSAALFLYTFLSFYRYRNESIPQSMGDVYANDVMNVTFYARVKHMSILLYFYRIEIFEIGAQNETTWFRLNNWDMSDQNDYLSCDLNCKEYKRQRIHW